MIVSKEQAKRYLVNYHGFINDNKFKGKEGICQFIKQVGCIQFDPLNVVGTNPNLVLQSRIETYTSQMLDALLYEDRVLVDGWDKMMAIYSTTDWPYFHRVRTRHAELNVSTMRNRGTTEALNYLGEVKTVIEEKGPKFSREVNVGGVEKGRWSSSRYANVALDQLFHLGELGVKSKKNSQKVFDLIEHLIPKSILNESEPFNTDEAFYEWYVKRRIDAIGFLWRRQGGAWLGHFVSNKKIRDQAINALLEKEQIIPFHIEGIKDEFYISHDRWMDLVNQESIQNKQVRFLAPLDNLMWDRDLIEVLFDFKYRWEVYTPKAKRQFGYYVLPVLYGENIVARFEPKKSKKEFELIDWWWEDQVEKTPALYQAIEKAFIRFAAYLEVAIDVEGIMKQIYMD